MSDTPRNPFGREAPQRRDDWDDGWGASQYELNAQYHEAQKLRAELAALRQENERLTRERDELRAQVNALLRVVADCSQELAPLLDSAANPRRSRIYDDAMKLLASTPEQSLAAHDREAIERCARVLEDYPFPQRMGADGTIIPGALDAWRAGEHQRYLIDAIRALADKEK